MTEILNRDEMGKELNSYTNETRNRRTDEEEVSTKAGNENNRKVGWRRYLGILFGFSASFCFSLTNLTNRLFAKEGYHPISVAFFRYPVIIVVMPLFIIYLRLVKNENVFAGLDKKTWFFLTLRGCIGFCGLNLFIYSVKYLSIADAVMITFSTPITVTLFARVCLGEPCGVIPVIVALVTLGGVVILTRPPLLTGAQSFDENTLIGTSFAFACMIAVSCAFVVIRHLRTVHYSLPVLFFGSVSAIIALIVGLIFGLLEFPRSTTDLAITVVSAVIVLLAQSSQTLSLKYEEAGPIALVRTLDIVFAFFLQLIFFDVYPDIFSIVGAFIITSGILVITFRKWLSTLDDKHPARVKYWFMLK